MIIRFETKEEERKYTIGIVDYLNRCFTKGYKPHKSFKWSPDEVCYKMASCELYWRLDKENHRYNPLFFNDNKKIVFKDGTNYEIIRLAINTILKKNIVVSIPKEFKDPSFTYFTH